MLLSAGMTNHEFGKAYEGGIRRTITFLLSRGVQPDIAPDVAQWAWVHGWERLELLRNETAVVSWVNTIALNHYRRIFQMRRTEEPLTDDCAGTAEINWASVDVERILEGCTEGHRLLLQAHLMGQTTDEIANELGVSATAVRIRLFRARRSVRKMLGLEEAQIADAA
jgi:RNA polymerase sigma factor (sigma-70 family)